MFEQFLDCPDSFWIEVGAHKAARLQVDDNDKDDEDDDDVENDEGDGDNYEDDKDKVQLGGLVTEGGFVQRRWCAMPNAEEQENN